MRPGAVLDAAAPLVDAFVVRASAFGHELPALDPAKLERLDHLTLHWEVSNYGTVDPKHNYNAQTINVNGNWLFQITHDPRANAVMLNDQSPDGSYAAHTLGRNSFNFGASVAAMWGATPSDFGQYPVKAPETEAFLAMCAAICVAYNLDALSSDVVKTHAEWAIIDDYYLGEDDDPRWDWARDAAAPGSPPVEEAEATAQRMRARMQKYKDAIIALRAKAS